MAVYGTTIESAKGNGIGRSVLMSGVAHAALIAFIVFGLPQFSEPRSLEADVFSVGIVSLDSIQAAGEAKSLPAARPAANAQPTEKPAVKVPKTEAARRPPEPRPTETKPESAKPTDTAAVKPPTPPRSAESPALSIPDPVAPQPRPPATPPTPSRPQEARPVTVPEPTEVAKAPPPENRPAEPTPPAEMRSVDMPAPRPDAPRPKAPETPNAVAATGRNARVETRRPPPVPRPRPEPEPEPETPKPGTPKKEPPKKTPPKEKAKPDKDAFADLMASAVGKTAPKSTPSKSTDTKSESFADRMMAAVGGEAQPQTGSGGLTDNELGPLYRKFRGCWNPPVGVAGAEELAVRLRISLRRSGEVESVTLVDQARSARDERYRAAAEAAVRAVWKCSPLPLPPDKFQQWQSINFNFRPRDFV